MHSSSYRSAPGQKCLSSGACYTPPALSFTKQAKLRLGHLRALLKADTDTRVARIGQANTDGRKANVKLLGALLLSRAMLRDGPHATRLGRQSMAQGSYERGRAYLLLGFAADTLAFARDFQALSYSYSVVTHTPIVQTHTRAANVAAQKCHRAHTMVQRCLREHVLKKARWWHRS